MKSISAQIVFLAMIFALHTLAMAETEMSGETNCSIKTSEGGTVEARISYETKSGNALYSAIDGALEVQKPIPNPIVLRAFSEKLRKFRDNNLTNHYIFAADYRVYMHIGAGEATITANGDYEFTYLYQKDAGGISTADYGWIVKIMANWKKRRTI